MTKKESKELRNGLYFLYWKSGGYSLAAVGILHDGTRWLAPTNWTNQNCEKVTSTKWSCVKKVTLIVTK